MTSAFLAGVRVKLCCVQKQRKRSHVYWNTAIKESKLYNKLFCELRLIRLAVVPQGGNTGLVGIWISLSPLSLFSLYSVL